MPSNLALNSVGNQGEELDEDIAGPRGWRTVDQLPPTPATHPLERFVGQHRQGAHHQAIHGLSALPLSSQAHALIVVSGAPQLWDVNTSELLGTFDFAGHTSGEQAWAVSISEKGMMLGVGQAGWLCAWDYRQRTPIFAYQPEEMVRVSRDDSSRLPTVAPGSNTRSRVHCFVCNTQRHSVGTFRYRTGFHCVQFNEAGDRCIVAGSHLPISDPSAVDSDQKDLDGIIQVPSTATRACALRHSVLWRFA
jgi:hypothetical protein